MQLQEKDNIKPVVANKILNEETKYFRILSLSLKSNKEIIVKIVIKMIKNQFKYSLYSKSIISNTIESMILLKIEFEILLYYIVYC